MSNPLITPRAISRDEFEVYTTNWYDLVTGDDVEKLRTSFKIGNDQIMNYAYLSADIMTNNLLYEVAPTQPCVWTKFALVPKDDDPETLLFSIILYSNNINPAGNGHPFYCLAGVREYPATIVAEHAGNPTIDEPVPTPTAAEWIQNWNNQHVDDIKFEMLGNEHERLLGYTFPLSDFQEAWQPAENAELWLDFDKHTQMFPTPDPQGPLLFSTLIDTNTTPVGDEPGTIIIDDYSLIYYDISRPCPPYCDANWTLDK